jgi:predicted anti-sigma-YlaC factor YlaD
MNCQELNSVLDTHPQNELSSSQRREVEGHFSSCRACREVWAAYGELIAEPIPETPQNLNRRIAAALDEQEADHAVRVRRSIVLGGVLFLGAAMATTLGVVQRERMYPSA